MNVRGDFIKFPHSTNTTALTSKPSLEFVMLFKINCILYLIKMQIKLN